MKFAVLLNRQGGTLKSLDVTELAQHISDVLIAHQHQASLHLVEGHELAHALEQITNDDQFDAIIVGGGDGSVSLAASHAWRLKKTLAVLPAGTINLFARSLHMSLDLELALAQIASGKPTSVDIVTANERPFLHQYSIGLQPEIVRKRDDVEHGSRLGKILTGVATYFDTIIRPPALDILIRHDGHELRKRVSLLCVSNNLYGRGHLPYSDGLNEGKIGIYWAPPLSAREYLKLTSDLLLGSWESNANLCEISASEVSVQIIRSRRYKQATIDGELVALDCEIRFKMHHKALSVIKPIDG